MTMKIITKPIKKNDLANVVKIVEGTVNENGFYIPFNTFENNKVFYPIVEYVYYLDDRVFNNEKTTYKNNKFRVIKAFYRYYPKTNKWELYKSNFSFITPSKEQLITRIDESLLNPYQDTEYSSVYATFDVSKDKGTIDLRTPTFAKEYEKQIRKYMETHPDSFKGRRVTAPKHVVKTHKLVKKQPFRLNVEGMF